MTAPAAAADAVVIGAGVVGAAIALELSRGGRSVTVVDREAAVGAGSTSASSAIIRFHYSSHAAVLTAWEAAALWTGFADFLGSPEGPVARFLRTGCLVLDHPGADRSDVLGRFDVVGVPYAELTPADIRHRYPALDPGDFSPPRPVDDPGFAAEPHGELGGYFTPDAGFVDDPQLAATNLMDAARRGGAQLRLRSEVVGIATQQGQVTGVELGSGETISAPVVVNAAGPGSSVINRMADVVSDMAISHRPLRQEVHVTPAPSGFGSDEGTIVTDPGLGTYFLPHPGGTLLVGGTEPECDPLEWVDDPTEFDPLPTAPSFERNVFRLARRLPTVGIPHRPLGVAGLYDVSDDWVPIYDKTNLGGFFLACGTSGNQFKNAPLVGTFLAALIDAAAAGHDHDAEPVRVRGRRTGLDIDLSAFSRRRQPTATSGSVLG